MAAIARLDPAVDWLLNAEEPVIRYRALVDLLDIPPDDARVTDPRRSIPGGPIVGTLLSGQLDDGGFGPQLLAESLVGWQWPDGGWNCDRREAAHHSSFHESLPAFRGLAAYARATGDRAVADATERAAEFFLRHRVTYSERTGRPIGPEAVRIHYPPYWRFDFLAGLRVLAESGHIGDPRTSDSLDLLEAKRGDDGRWAAEAVQFRPPGARSLPDAVDWGRRTPSEPVTLGAMLVLRAAGRARTGTDRGTIGVP
jgi:hypothetical protein